jgi:predicted RNA-binding Zn-ribbon protein involved in translation (DUF1610 family)
VSRKKAQPFKISNVLPYAYHEAGHAVVGHVIGRLIEHVSIASISENGYRGYCRFSLYIESANCRLEWQEDSANPDIVTIYAAWGRFLAWLTYYGLLHTIPVIAVESAFTSQDCSSCGTRVKKSLSVRTHICPGCGLILDRDHNAALNILAKALDHTGGQSETGGQPQNAWGEPPATLLSAMGAGQDGSWNQEPLCL